MKIERSIMNPMIKGTGSYGEDQFCNGISILTNTPHDPLKSISFLSERSWILLLSLRIGSVVPATA